MALERATLSAPNENESEKHSVCKTNAVIAGGGHEVACRRAAAFFRHVRDARSHDRSGGPDGARPDAKPCLTAQAGPALRVVAARQVVRKAQCGEVSFVLPSDLNRGRAGGGGVRKRRRGAMRAVRMARAMLPRRSARRLRAARPRAGQLRPREELRQGARSVGNSALSSRSRS